MRTIVLVRFILASILISSVVPSGRGWAAEKKNDAPQIPTTKPTAKPTATAIVKLPAPAAAVCVGGGGKYLILHLKKLQQLAIFDVSQGKVVKYLPVPANELVFAAGLEKLFVGYKELRQIQRYDLESWKLELTVAGPEGGIGALAAGAGAAGPVLMLGADRTKHFWLMDPVTLKATPYPSKHWGNEGGAWGPVQIRMSFDGTTAVATGGGWAGIEISTIAGGKVNDVHTGGRLPGDVNISGDGTLVFTDRSSTLRGDLETKVSGIDGSPFPADAPGFSLSWLKEKGKEKASLIVFANAETKPLLLLHDLPELGQGIKLSLAERIHLIPSQSALVMLGSGADELLVRKFDLAEEMAASGIDYLFVSSTPPTHAERGAAYSYEMKVLSKRGSVKSELQAGPPGMKLDADGKLQWTVPRDFGSAMASVIIQIADASGQTTFHTFTIRIGGIVPAAPVVAVTPTQKPEKSEKPKIPNVTEPQPPAPKAPEVTTLAEPFHEYHAAAGGKVLVFYQQKAKQLALYEAATGKTLGNIAIGADNAIFACGADAIIVVLPDQKILQRYDLKTRARVKSAPIPNQNPIKHIGMGNASTGPFFMYSGGEMVAINPVTLEPLKHRGALPSGDPNWWFDFRVSADGSTVVSWDSYASPSNYTITHLKNGAVVSVGSDEGFSMGNRRFTPTADGSLILYETKFYSAETKPLASTLSGYANAIPTSDPRYFIAVKESKVHRSAAAICTVAERRVLAEVDALPDVGDTNGRDGGRCGVVMDMAGAGEPRLVYLAESKTLVAIPMSNDRFERIKVDLNAALAGDPASGNAATQALAVVSLPPKEAVVNEVYSYQLQVLPEKAVVTYKVESGPSGLAVSAKGLVTWKPTLRPIGGRANVILSVTDAAGHDVPHAFEIAVTRVAGAPADGVTSTGAIVKADEHRLELPDKEYRYVPGMAGKVLLLSGNQLAILAADGFTIEKTLTLPKSYQLIGERKNYYVAVCQEPRSIDLLDKTTLKIVRTRAVSFNALDDLTLHPTKPISYVSYVESGEGPTHHFMMFDETTAEARTNDNWLGDWLAISPEGNFLLTGFQETYRKGHEIIDNPDRIWIVPTYGSHDLLCRYDLDPRNGMPVRVASRDKVGGNGNGIRLSADGKRATYLSFTGYPQMSHNLGGWDPLDLSKLPVGYNVKDIATTKDLTFHPVLPMVACYGKASVVFFDRESGVKLDGKIPEDALAGEDIQRVFFSPDGKSLITETIVHGLHYLFHVPIKLSAEEIREVGSLPRPDKPLDAKPFAPAPGGIQKLPKVQA